MLEKSPKLLNVSHDLLRCSFLCCSSSVSLSIEVWCQCLEISVVVLPSGHVSSRMQRRGNSCVELKLPVRELGLYQRELQFIPSVFLYNTFYFGGKTPQRRFFDPTCASPASAPLHHVHPILMDFHCTFWKGLQPSAGSWRTKRRGGGSSLSSLQHFRGITWPDKHAFALVPCSTLTSTPNPPKTALCALKLNM